MGAFESKILDALKSLAVSLQLSMLIPSFLLVGGVLWLINPSIFTTDLFLVIAFPVITVSYLFNAFNMVIFRFLEGYIRTDSTPLKLLREYQLSKFYRHHQRIYEYNEYKRKIAKLRNDLQHARLLTEDMKKQLDRWEMGWKDRIWHEKERLEERFPPTPDRILPTGFGNTIHAWELYSDRRYCIDVAQIWPRFAPILLEQKYATYIENEKAILDLFVNLLVVSGLLWPISVFLFAYSGRLDTGLLFGGLPIFAYVIYRGACVAASNWGTTLKAAIDLYRFDLGKLLKLKLPQEATLTDERAMWQGISEFLAYGRLDNFKGFDYASAFAQEEKPT